jgi:UDP-N-acetylmuramoyl-tripeptide--D-alanyl-D-alanine ligase
LGECRVLLFGSSATADVLSERVRVEAEGSRFHLCTPIGSMEVALSLPGRHNVANALAATAMAIAAGATLAAIVAGLSTAVGVAGRQQTHVLENGARLIDDSYNANPGSVAAAIQTLAARPGERWLVLGDMRELGVGEGALHAQVGQAARAARIDRLYTVGALSAAAARAFGAAARHFDSQAALSEALAKDLRCGTTCLVKGSRGSRMDRVVSALLGSRADAAEASHAA